MIFIRNAAEIIVIFEIYRKTGFPHTKTIFNQRKVFSQLKISYSLENILCFRNPITMFNLKVILRAKGLQSKFRCAGLLGIVRNCTELPDIKGSQLRASKINLLLKPY